MGRSSKVMTPRNVELPNHYMTLPTSGSLHPNPGSDLLVAPSPTSSAKKPIEPRKKCLCLTVWLFVLLLLCVGIVVIANFLLPSMAQGHNQKLILNGLGTQVDKCLETAQGASLEQKTILSDFIVVATMGGGSLNSNRNETKIKVSKILKGSERHEVEKHLFVESEAAPCDLPEVTEAGQHGNGKKQKFVFFLYRSTGDGKWRQRFKAVDSSSKLIDVIETLLEEEGVTLKNKRNKKKDRRVEEEEDEEKEEKAREVVSAGIGLGSTQGKTSRDLTIL